MTINARYLNVSIAFPNGNTVVLDESLNLRVRIEKNALAMQNKADIEVSGLSESVRAVLLSSFTAWNKRLVTSGQIPQNFVPVIVQAGYYTPAGTQIATRFKGEVALCELISGPPEITVRITAYTRQVDKTKFITGAAPASMTYGAYVAWAAGQMGFGNNYVCDTSYNNTIVVNPARSMYTVSSLVWDIQDLYKPNVAAFVDDDRLIVKDQNKILNTSAITKVTQFVGIPNWTEWGVQFKTLLNLGLTLATGCTLTSVMNPTINGTYIITRITDELTSRDIPFYTTVFASPSAGN